MTTVPRTLTLRLPLPPRALSPNGSRGHWASHATAARDYRERCRLTAIPQLSGFMIHPARLTHRFVYCQAGHRDPRCVEKHRARCQCDYQPRDADNALSATKPLRDALVALGALWSDTMANAVIGGVTSARCQRGCRCGGFVELQIEELPA